MSEGHSHVIRELFDPANLEVTFATHATEVKIETSNGTRLTGIVAGKSMAIPFSTARDSDPMIMTIAEDNLSYLSLNGSESAVIAASKVLGLCFNCETEGLFADGQGFGQINALHLHPGNRVTSPEDFIILLKKVLEKRQIKISFAEFTSESL